MTPLRIIMLSYERGFLDPTSDARTRLHHLASSDAKVSAIVLSDAKKASVEERGTVRVIGVMGSPTARFLSAFRAAYREVKRARLAGETPVLSAQDPFVA